MENKLRDAFDKIHAEDDLKKKTAGYLHAEIQKRGRRRGSARIRIAVVCLTSVLVILAGSFSHNLYITPSAFVDMDVNPSIELTLNCFDRVLEANPYNDDGADILQEVNVKNKTYEQAIQTLLSEMIRQGYLKADGLVSVTVQANDGEEEQAMLDKVQTSVDSSLASHHTTVPTDIFAVSSEVRQCAREHNLSPAKYVAITQLQEVDSTATYEGCAEHSISEIWQYTEEHGGEHHHGTGEDEAESSVGENHEKESRDCSSADDPESGTSSRGQHKKEHSHHRSS